MIRQEPVLFGWALFIGMRALPVISFLKMKPDLVLFQGCRPPRRAQFINKPLAPFPGTTSILLGAMRSYNN